MPKAMAGQNGVAESSLHMNPVHIAAKPLYKIARRFYSVNRPLYLS
jgi:hypothetical protein